MGTTDARLRIQVAKVTLDMVAAHERDGDEDAVALMVTRLAKWLGLTPSHDPYETWGMIDGLIIAAQ